MKRILYLHGFRSSPLSFKARMLSDYFLAAGRAEDFICPQLPASPRAAILLAEQIIEKEGADKISLIGSSLGGFYASYLTEKLGCRAVLLNPAVNAGRDLEKHVGVMTAYHSDARFEFTDEYVMQLRDYSVDTVARKACYFLLAATGDEVLDSQEMLRHFSGARQRVIQGSDHGLSDFANYIDEVVAFCDAQEV